MYLQKHHALSGVVFLAFDFVSKLRSAGRIRTYDQLVTSVPLLLMGWTISSSFLDAGRFPDRLSDQVLPCGIVSTPSLTFVGAWLGIALGRNRWGFPEFTSFFNSSSDEKLPLTASRSTTELPRSEVYKLLRNIAPKGDRCILTEK